MNFLGICSVRGQNLDLPKLERKGAIRFAYRKTRIQIDNKYTRRLGAKWKKKEARAREKISYIGFINPKKWHLLSIIAHKSSHSVFRAFVRTLRFVRLFMGETCRTHTSPTCTYKSMNKQDREKEEKLEAIDHESSQKYIHTHAH